MLKLTTDKHEASRGLSATAELLVMSLPSYMGGGGYYVATMPRCPDAKCQHRHFFRFARIMNGFRRNLGEVITTTNR